ncbi:MAG: hypothetical protein INQ03_12270 [Candidatus Heimdallarchaeota archaeon]|nr:hypothetical protein [Candidatus Heimdallarchaeota archaeon]
MSVDPSILFNTSMGALNRQLAERPMADNLGTIFLVVWLIAGALEDPYLYVLSMAITSAIFFAGLFSSISKKIPIDTYGSAAFRRLLIAMWATAMYDSGLMEDGILVGGPAIVNIGIAIDVDLLTFIITAGYAVLWFALRNLDKLDMHDLASMNTIFLILKGISRGIIMVALLLSVFSTMVYEDPYLTYILYAYLADPLITYIQAHYDQSLDPIKLQFGYSKIPNAALRDVMISNLLILIFTMWFGGIGDPLPQSWQIMRTAYVLVTVAIFVYARDSLKQFKKNPLGSSPLGSILDETQNVIKNMDLKQKMGYTIEKDMNVQMNKENSMNIYRNSVIVPLGETKQGMKALVIGRGESIIKTKGDLSSQLIDGVSSLVIPKNQFKQIRKQVIPRKLETLDFNALELPSFEQIMQIVNALGFNMGSWVEKLRTGLANIDLSNYGVTTMGDNTHVKFPGFEVIEGKGMTKFNGFGIDVLETPGMTNVKIGSFINVIELPKMTLVTLPFMTVLELEGQGTAVDIFGFKISDGIDANRLEEFKQVVYEQMQRFNAMKEHELGRILVEKKANALMSVSWDGQFHSLLSGKKDNFGNHPALAEATMDSSRLLGGSVDQSVSTIDPKFVELTGFGTTKKEQKKSKVNVQVNLGKVGKVGKIGDVNIDKILDDVQGELDRVREDLSDKPERKEKVEDTKIYDVDYEIVEDEE